MVSESMNNRGLALYDQTSQKIINAEEKRECRGRGGFACRKDLFLPSVSHSGSEKNAR